MDLLDRVTPKVIDFGNGSENIINAIYQKNFPNLDGIT